MQPLRLPLLITLLHYTLRRKNPSLSGLKRLQPLLPSVSAFIFKAYQHRKVIEHLVPAKLYFLLILTPVFSDNRVSYHYLSLIIVSVNIIFQ